MILNIKKTSRNVHTINATELSKIESYIDYISINQFRAGQWYAARDFFGGSNADWTGTPLELLYQRRLQQYRNHFDSKKDAFKQAGRDLGHIIKNILSKSVKYYKECKRNRVKCYMLL